MKSKTTRLGQSFVLIGWAFVLISFFIHDAAGITALALIALSSICFGLSLVVWNYLTEESKIRDIKKPKRFRFSIIFLLALTTMAACGLSYFLMISLQLRIDNHNVAEMELSHRFIAIDADSNPDIVGYTMGDEQQLVLPESCGPSLDLNDYRIEDFRRSYRLLEMLRPQVGKSHVAMYLSPQLVADSSFIAELKAELPRYAIFDRFQLRFPQEGLQAP